jgi:hypothetical protein
MLEILERAVETVKAVVTPKPDPAAKLAEDREKWKAEAALFDARKADEVRIEAELNAMCNGAFQPNQNRLAAKNAELTAAGEAVYRSMHAEKMLELKRPITREERKLSKELEAEGAIQSSIREKLSDCSLSGIGRTRNALERNLEMASGKFTDDNGEKVNRKPKPEEVAEAQAKLDKFIETDIQPWTDVLADKEKKIEELRGRIEKLKAESCAA